MSQKYAFRCRNCGHLEEAGQAGERSVPAACRVCGHGVAFDPVTGIKTYDEDNWLVLADASDAELNKVYKHHGISKSDIAKHKPAPSADPDRVPVSIERSATDEVTHTDSAGDAA